MIKQKIKRQQQKKDNANPTMWEMNMIQVDCCKEMFIETKKFGNPNNKQRTKRQQQITKQHKPKQTTWEMNTIEVVNMSVL